RGAFPPPRRSSRVSSTRLPPRSTATGENTRALPLEARHVDRCPRTWPALATDPLGPRGRGPARPRPRAGLRRRQGAFLRRAPERAEPLPDAHRGLGRHAIVVAGPPARGPGPRAPRGRLLADPHPLTSVRGSHAVARGPAPHPAARRRGAAARSQASRPHHRRQRHRALRVTRPARPPVGG